jgi:DNA primase large subunit
LSGLSNIQYSIQPKDAVEISLKDIDQLAKTSFPLCMRHMLEKLRENHHLKHGGRMQFGLFLKGAGLKLEDALAFWRAEFSQKVPNFLSECKQQLCFGNSTCKPFLFLYNTSKPCQENFL